MYGGQAMVHTSGALGAEVLAPAMAAGTQIGAFHPLVAFADTERAVAALHGATVAIEGDDQLAALLAGMAEAIGATPGPAGARARRPPTTPRRSWRPAGSSRCSTRSPSSAGSPGSTRPGSLAIYGPLIEGTLGNARALGIRAALTGPMTRGDVGTLEAHLATLRAPRARTSSTLYVAAARREIDLAEARGALAPEDATKMRAVLARPCKPGLNRYHSLPWTTASRPSTRPARRPNSSAPRRASASGDSASARPDRSSAPAARATVAARPGRRAARPAPGRLARDPPRRHAAHRSAAVRGRWWSWSGPGPDAPASVRRPGAASAPWPA